MTSHTSYRHKSIPQEPFPGYTVHPERVSSRPPAGCHVFVEDWSSASPWLSREFGFPMSLFGFPGAEHRLCILSSGRFVKKFNEIERNVKTERFLEKKLTQTTKERKKFLNKMRKMKRKEKEG